jgi:hypothetical protein
MEDTTPLVAGKGMYLRGARQFRGPVCSTNRTRHVEITTRGVALQQVLAVLY